MSKPPDQPVAALSGWTLESAYADDGPVLHPLTGANFRTFAHQYFGHGGYTVRSLRQRALAWVGQALLGPFAAVERVRWGQAIRDHRIERPPVFLIGHWRSGTTHLHNMLARDPQFGYLDLGQANMPWHMLGEKVHVARSVIAKVLPKTRGYDNVKLSLEEPQEEEWALANLNPVSLFNCYYFPADAWRHAREALFLEGLEAGQIEAFEQAYEFLVRKVSFARQGNPSSTVRIPMLKRLFPHAKFIHIVRNPYAVYRSNRAKFARLFNAFAWQDFRAVDGHRFTMEFYEAVMRRYLEDRISLRPEDLYETSYERLTEHPLDELGRIYEQLKIGGREEGLESIAGYLETIKDYRANVHTITEAQAAEVRERWGFAFEAWNYPLDPPDAISVAG